MAPQRRVAEEEGSDGRRDCGGGRRGPTRCSRTSAHRGRCSGTVFGDDCGIEGQRHGRGSAASTMA
ncbi:hypothetical protein E2562_022262 [Oryza meyeriana var. granulata]|uniref:Uncharacterized protein n=1 Tax=Oryza meyeriana var. granulata TaxID=110450 RepID=A0A6G1D536_9ORYZ|nr:hypothetical protein E2562_022262 [Oryza meyeriana var. granulata]